MVAKLTKRQKKEALEGYLCVLPWIIGFFVLFVGPSIASIVLSFCKYDMVTSPKFIGLENYRMAFMGEDSLFWQSLGVTFKFVAMSLPLNLALSLGVALLLNQKVRGIGIYRTIYYLPAILPIVAVSILWIWIFNPDFGISNYALWKLFRIVGPSWLFNKFWALPALVIMGFWGIGPSMLIYLAGLQGIPKQLYESAEIDGAGWWKKFCQVTIPQMSPVIFFNLVMGTIVSFQVFTQAYLMTNGGPHHATLFYMLNLYNNAFQYFKMGYSSALAWILFIIILGFTILIFKSSSAWVYYGGTIKGRVK